MQDSNPQKIPHGCVFVKNHFSKQSISSWQLAASDETAYSPYMLDAINDIDRLFLVRGKRRGVSSLKKIETRKMIDTTFTETQFPGERGDAIMVRVSDCKYFAAIVFKSSIIIVKSETFLKQKILDEGAIEVEFCRTEGKYSYLEWPSLNHDYIEKPYFLTLDDQGKIRIHYMKDRTERIVSQGDFYQCATFSWDGRYIYAINEEQEICQIDFETSRLLMKRKVKGFSDSERVISSHIQQVTPLAFAIGSVEKIGDEVIEKFKESLPAKAEFKSYLHIVSGDFSEEDSEKELKIKAFEIPSLQFDQDKTIIFRSLYIKERGLLLFGHTRCFKLLAITFKFDGNFTENSGIALLNPALRGIALMSEEKDQKILKGIVAYHEEMFNLPKPPKIVILDGEGLIHIFQYYDTRFVAPKLSMYVRHISIDEFGQKQKQLKEGLNPKNKNRSKSQHKRRRRREKFGQGKCRSKSQDSPHSEVKITKQPKINNEQKAQTEQKAPIVEGSLLQEIEVDEAKKAKSAFAEIKQAEGIVPPKTSSYAIHQRTGPFLEALLQESEDNKPESLWAAKMQTSPAALLFSRNPAIGSNQIKNNFLHDKKIEEKTENPFLSVRKTEVNTENPFLSIKKTEVKTENPFLSVKNTEERRENPFLSVKKKEVKTENPFLATQKVGVPSFAQVASQSANNSRFSSTTSQPNLFAKLRNEKAKSEEETKQNLFSRKREFDFSSEVSGLGSNNLFSTNVSSKICLRLFPTNDKRNSSLFLEKEGSDILFKVENEEFPAHKSIMGERCKFFKNMFSSGMLEAYSSVITIPETKASMFKAFLEYIYLEQFVMNEDLAENLMDFSERYIIADLKKACENSLCLNLRIDNFLRLYEAACLYDSHYLKEKILIFIERSLEKILEKYKFQDLPIDSLFILKAHFEANPVLGPSISQLIVK